MNMLKSTLFGLLGLVWLASCGDDDTASSADEIYNGKGSRWEITFKGDGTFSGTEADSSSTVSGTWSDLSTGFRQLTFTSSTGSTAPSNNSTTWGIVVPGVAIILAPILSDETKPITMLRKGNCPTSSVAFNWIMNQVGDSRDVSDSNEQTYGHFTWDGSTTVTVNTGYALANNGTNLISSTEQYSGSCSDGLISLDCGNATCFINLTQSGSAMVDTGEELVFGITQEELTASAIASEEMVGIIYQASGSSNSDRFTPATMTLNSAGTGGTVTLKNNETASATDSGSATLTFTGLNSPQNGLVTGTITADGQSGNLAASVVADVASTGKTAVFGAGQEPGNTTKGYVVMFVSKSASSSVARGLRSTYHASFNWLKSLLGL